MLRSPTTSRLLLVLSMVFAPTAGTIAVATPAYALAPADVVATAGDEVGTLEGSARADSYGAAADVYESTKDYGWCAAFVGWLIWVRLRRQHDDFATNTPQFAPPRTFTPPPTFASPAPSTPQPSAADAPAAVRSPSPLAADRAPARVTSAATAADEEPAPASATSADSAAGLPEGDDAELEVSGYCMRCKTKRLIQDAHRETTESGRPAARGTCPVCRANMFTFLAATDNA